MAKWTCPDCGSELKKKSSSHFTTKKHLAAVGGSTPSPSGDYDYPTNEQGQEKTIAEFLAEAGASPPLSGEIGNLRDNIKFDTKRSEQWQGVYDAYVKSVDAPAGNKNTQTLGGHTQRERDVIRHGLNQNRRGW